jgi:hypothetical protein
MKLQRKVLKIPFYSYDSHHFWESYPTYQLQALPQCDTKTKCITGQAGLSGTSGMKGLPDKSLSDIGTLHLTSILAYIAISVLDFTI